MTPLRPQERSQVFKSARGFKIGSQASEKPIYMTETMSKD